MVSISKKLYIHKLDNMIIEYSNTYHRTIKMKPDGVKSSAYIDFDKENYKENTVQNGTLIQIWKSPYMFMFI